MENIFKFWEWTWNFCLFCWQNVLFSLRFPIYYLLSTITRCCAACRYSLFFEAIILLTDRFKRKFLILESDKSYNNKSITTSIKPELIQWMEGKLMFFVVKLNKKWQSMCCSLKFAKFKSVIIVYLKIYPQILTVFSRMILFKMKCTHIHWTVEL